MISKITDYVYLGDFYDAKNIASRYPNVDILCVLEEVPLGEPLKAYWISAFKLNQNSNKDEDDMVAIVSQLDKIADFIDNEEKAGRRILVHCAAGQERSPLVIIWFLYRKRGFSLDSAYKYVKARRPQIYDRIHWLPEMYKRTR